jgi:hypothetical protein
MGNNISAIDIVGIATAIGVIGTLVLGFITLILNSQRINYLDTQKFENIRAFLV